MKRSCLVTVLVFWVLPLGAEQVQISTVPVSSLPGVSTTTVPAAASPAASTEAPTAQPPVHRTAMNEATGTVLELDQDARTLRVAADGGYNIGFTYDQHTTFTNGGHSMDPGDLGYGDKVAVRYVGMELNAVEIERLPKNP